MSIRGLAYSHVDLSKIPPLEPNRLVGFINHFASSLVQVSDEPLRVPCLIAWQQLSNLNNAADLRLFRLHSRILTCKTNLLILERKLASVDGLSVAPAPVPATTPAPSQTVPDARKISQVNEDVGKDRPEESHAEVEQDDTDNAQSHEKDDPELCRFYKMLKVGVPLPAVRMKMVSEGVDPDRLKV